MPESELNLARVGYCDDPRCGVIREVWGRTAGAGALRLFWQRRCESIAPRYQPAAQARSPINTAAENKTPVAPTHCRVLWWRSGLGGHSGRRLGIFVVQILAPTSLTDQKQ